MPIPAEWYFPANMSAGGGTETEEAAQDSGEDAVEDDMDLSALARQLVRPGKMTQPAERGSMQQPWLTPSQQSRQASSSSRVSHPFGGAPVSYEYDEAVAVTAGRMFAPGPAPGAVAMTMRGKGILGSHIRSNGGGESTPGRTTVLPSSGAVSAAALNALRLLAGERMWPGSSAQLH
jgi:hypothetical protein